MTGGRAPARVALVGAAGHGRSHLRNLARLHDLGRIELVGACDVAPLDPEGLALLPAGAPLVGDHRQLLAATGPEVVVVCTPPHTHLPIATDVVAAGADLLLEKPPVAGVAEHDRLARLLREAGRACQVGFQAIGSPALTELVAAIRSGRLGELEAVTATGTWIRTDAYWARSRWAGRRSLDGRPVPDGALSNPFAHAVMNALVLGGAGASASPSVGAGTGAGSGTDGRAGPVRLELDLYRAREIEVDETACLRATLPGGVALLVAVTLCAESHRSPEMVVRGGAGEAVLHYKEDRLRLPGDPEPRVVPGPVDLLENLLDHRADPEGVPLLVPLAATRTFTAIVEAINTGAAPRPIDPAFLRVSGSGGDRRVVVAGVDAAIERAAGELALFWELGVPWAAPLSAIAPLPAAAPRSATAPGRPGPRTDHSPGPGDPLRKA